MCSASTYAQHPAGKWYSCAPLPGLNNESGGQLLFVDSLLGYYIGADTGYITYDGGQSWTWINFPSTARPFPTFLYSPDHNTIICYQKHNLDSNGTPYPGIIKSIDMGKTWSLVSATAIPNKIATFTMWNINDGFRIWLDDQTQKPVAAATHDGGITWTDVTSDATLTKYLKLQGSGSLSLHDAWSDKTHGAISVSLSSKAGSTTAYPVLFTTDGGKTWTETYPKYNNDATISHTYIFSYPGSQSYWVQPTVLANSAEYFYFSPDAGTTWTTTPQFTLHQLGAQTKPEVIQLAPVSATETWALVASDSEHQDLTRFMAYYQNGVGWTRTDTIKFGSTGGAYGWSLIDNGIQFADRTHGWVKGIQTYFDTKNQTQVTKDSLFLFSFRTSPPKIIQGAVAPSLPVAALRCMPNPASSHITISGLESDEVVREIRIANSLGKEISVVAKNTGAEINLDMSNFPAGSYYVKVNTSYRQESIPVMVVR
jgi:hypothetical protein